MRVTPAGLLAARFVIHGVAPRWKGGNHGELTLLGDLYGAIASSAEGNGCRTVALPSFGTGAFGFSVNAPVVGTLRLPLEKDGELPVAALAIGIGFFNWSW